MKESVMKDYLEYLNESPTVFFKCKNAKGWPIEFVTENVKNVLGYNSKDFLSEDITFMDIVYKEDLDKLVKDLNYIQATHIDKFEFKPYRLVSKNKKKLWVQDITNFKKDKNGNITHLHCYITDISKQIQKDKKLVSTEDIISTIYNNSIQFIGLMEPDGTLIRANKTSLEFVNIKESDVLGKKFWDCPWWQHSVKDQEELKEDIQKASKGELIRKNKIHFDNDGNKIYVDFTIKPVFNNKKEVIYLIPEGHNITDSILKDKELEKYLRIINENVLISKTDLDGKILSCSDKFCKISGFSRAELLGNRHNIMKDPNASDSFYKNLWETITSGEVWVGEHKNINKNGKVFWVENIITPNYDENGQIESFTSIYNDITLRKEILELSITDELTNLYNRRHFNKVFVNELKKSKRHHFGFALMIIDVDFFKQYNDTYGHVEGDKALIAVSEALTKTLQRADDYLFRLGGEEFAIITTDIDSTGVIKLANNLRKNVEALNIKHMSSNVSEHLTISVGIKAVNSTCILSFEEIYKYADLQLYKAKEKGRNRISI